VTTEIAVSPRGAGVDAFDWRVSRAVVAEDGPFSAFPGVDRTLVVLDGDGVTLHVASTGEIALRPGQVARFRGEDPVRAALHGGPIRDLNLMVRRAAYHHDADVVRVSGVTPVGEGDPLLVVAIDGAVVAAGIALAPGEVVVARGAVDADGEGTALVARLRPADRDVRWGGLHNTRDLGGLPFPGGVTRFGALYRAPALDRLSDAGWQDLVDAGVRTVVDLRNADEIPPFAGPVGALRRHHRPIEDQGDTEFMRLWGQHLGTPRYYADVLQRWREKVVAAVAAIARAPGGGVVYHCMAGRDRTGMVTALVLRLVGVDVEVVADDYARSVRAANAFQRAHPTVHGAGFDDDRLEAWVTETRGHLLAFLAELDVPAYLRSAGMAADDVGALARRIAR
jgi:hypothetical protein